MTPPEKQDYGLRHFPPDLLAALAIPILATTIFLTWLSSLRGTPWICAFGASTAIAMLGATLLFLAKLPLHRQGRFFTFGSEALPESAHGFYRWGCRCSSIGCTLMFLFWLTSSLWASR